MFVINKIKDLKRVNFLCKIRLLIFQLLKTLKLPFPVRDYELNSFLTSHLISFNGFLLKESKTTFTSVFTAFKYSNNKYLRLTLRKPPSSDFLVFDQIFVNEEYRPLVNLITEKCSLDQSLVVIDAGGNIGAFSIYLSNYLPNASFLIIEPDENNFKILKNNIHQNKIRVLNLIRGGLWINDTYLEIKRDFRDKNDWAIRVQETHNVTKLKGYSLETLIINGDIKIIDILKIDIEGSEKELFSDFKKIQDVLKKVKFIAIEIHDEYNCRRNIVDTLDECGFILMDNGETTFGYNKYLVN